MKMAGFTIPSIGVKDDMWTASEEKNRNGRRLGRESKEKLCTYCKTAIIWLILTTRPVIAHDCCITMQTACVSLLLNYTALLKRLSLTAIEP